MRGHKNFNGVTPLFIALLWPCQSCKLLCCLSPTRLKLHNAKLSKQNGLLSNVETGSQEFVILSYVIVYRHPSVSSNNEKICHKISEDKIADCEKTACLYTERELFRFELCSVPQSVKPLLHDQIFFDKFHMLNVL